MPWGARHVQARLLEHNVRFGDPECQCLMVRLQSDLLGVLLAAADSRLGSTQLQWSPEKALTVCRLGTRLSVRPLHLRADRGSRQKQRTSNCNGRICVKAL